MHQFFQAAIEHQVFETALGFRRHKTQFCQRGQPIIVKAIWPHRFAPLPNPLSFYWRKRVACRMVQLFNSLHGGGSLRERGACAKWEKSKGNKRQQAISY